MQKSRSIFLSSVFIAATKCPSMGGRQNEPEPFICQAKNVNVPSATYFMSSALFTAYLSACYAAYPSQDVSQRTFTSTAVSLPCFVIFFGSGYTKDVLRNVFTVIARTFDGRVFIQISPNNNFILALLQRPLCEHSATAQF